MQEVGPKDVQMEVGPIMGIVSAPEEANQLIFGEGRKRRRADLRAG